MSAGSSRTVPDSPVTLLVVSPSGRLCEALSPLSDEHENVALTCFETAKAAIERIEAGTDGPLLVSELALPNRSGVELLSHVRQQDSTVPVVLSGSEITLPDESIAIDAGAADVVRLSDDPASEAVLRARVVHALQRSEFQRLQTDATEVASPARLRRVEGNTVQRLFDAASRQEVAELAVSAATEVGAAYAELHLANEPGSGHHCVASYPHDRAVVNARDVAHETLVRETDARGEPRVLSDADEREAQESASNAVVRRTELLTISVGDAGFLHAGVEKPEGKNGATADLLASLSSISAAALERVDQVQAAHRRKQQFDSRSTRLSRLTERSDLLLGIVRAVIEADSRVELAQRVCEELLTVEAFEFAWFGTVERQQDRIDPACWAGNEQRYLDGVDGRVSDTNDEPAVRAVLTRNVTVVDDITSGRHSWSTGALDRGFLSVLSVPVLRDGYSSGVVTVFASETDSFDGATRQLFREIADVITYGNTVLAWKRALVADTVTDLEVTLTGATDPFSRVARDTGATLEVADIIPKANSALLFLAVSGDDSTAVEAAFEAEESVESVDNLSAEDRTLFEIELQLPELVDDIVAEGGALQELTTDGNATDISVVLPVEAEVRRFMDVFERAATMVRLRSRSQRVRPSKTDLRYCAAFEQHVTDRQLEALRTAHLSGYFEWPREHTGEEVADLLGISQPTFNRHLRVALQNLLYWLFDGSGE